MEVIKSSVLFRSLGSQHLGVEVWPDPDAPDAGETYFWVVSRFGEGNVRILAYVRVGTGRLDVPHLRQGRRRLVAAGGVKARRTKCCSRPGPQLGFAESLLALAAPAAELGVRHSVLDEVAVLGR